MGVLILGPSKRRGSDIDLSQDTIRPEFVLNGKTFHGPDGTPRVGTILNWDGTVLSGGGSGDNPHVIAPSLNARYIPAGRHLGKDVVLSPMPQGTATLSRDGNVVTLNKTAGHINGGTDSMAVPAYTGDNAVTPAALPLTLPVAGKYCPNDLVVRKPANLIASNIRSGVNLLGVEGSYAGASYDVYNGVTAITPGYSNQRFYTSGYYVNSNLLVYGDSNLIASNIRRGVSIFGVSGSYEGASATPSTGTGSVSGGSPSLSISSPSGTTLYMAGFILSSVPSSVNNLVLAGEVRRGSSVGRNVVITSAGTVAAGNNLSASFSGNTVTISISSPYVFFGSSYTAYICYL